MYRITFTQIFFEISHPNILLIIAVCVSVYMIAGTFNLNDMDVIKDTFGKILSKLPKNTLVTIVVILACLYGNKLLKESKSRQEGIVKNQEVIMGRQINIEKIVNKGFLENKKGHDDIIFDLREVNEKQKVVIETLPEISKKTVKQIQEIYNQMRKDRMELESYTPIESIEQSLTYSGLIYIDPEIILVQDTVKKKE